MKNPEQPKTSVTDETDPREPYESPRLDSEQLFEVLALACGKTNPTSASCRAIARTS